jgi:hypothetical protein
MNGLPVSSSTARASKLGEKEARITFSEQPPLKSVAASEASCVPITALAGPATKRQPAALASYWSLIQHQILALHQ